MKLKHVIIGILIVVGLLLLRLLFAKDISPEDFHTESIEALLDPELYDGSKAIDDLPALKPFLYLNRPEATGSFFLYVLVPVPEGTTIGSPTLDSPTAGTLRVKYRAESGDPTGPTSGLYLQTRIEVAADVDTVVVECAMSGGGTGTSTVGTSDSDQEDPISGGPATPFMSGMTTDGLMLYTGGDECSTIIELRSGAVTGTIPSTPAFQRFDPGSPDFILFTVGKRKVKGVW